MKKLQKENKINNDTNTRQKLVKTKKDKTTAKIRQN